MYGRKGTFHRYYHCPNHDVLRAGSDDRRCPERNIRANELDQYVFEQVRQALLDPQQLVAAERAVIAGAPDENELVATQLKRLDTAIDAKERERTRLLDAYQAGLIELDELTRRTATLTARREQLTQEKDALTKRSAELATENRLRRGLAGFAERVAASLDELDFEGRQRLLRLVVEKVRVTGWRVEIHLKIPLPTNHHPTSTDPNDGPPDPDPDARTGRPSHCQAICACVPIIEMSREGIPLPLIQRQLGHADLGITSAYLRGIDNTEIIHASVAGSAKCLQPSARPLLTRPSKSSPMQVAHRDAAGEWKR